MASTSTTAQTTKNFGFAVINNIPNDYHSADLRNFFSQFIEKGGFDCFHFRHRPEKLQPSENVGLEVEANQKPELSSSSKRSFCCVVRLINDNANELIKMYHKQHWLDKKGESIPRLCLITKLTVRDFYGHQGNLKQVLVGW